MLFRRASGVLLHPTSLPGPYGIGDLGPDAYRFVDFLAASGQRLWQIMPLGPTGYGDSPYSSLSAFAGNPLLISLDQLRQADLLSDDDLRDVPDFPAERVEFGWVIPWKRERLERAFRRYRDGAGGVLRERLEALERSADVRAWLPDFALFMALKERHHGALWSDWEQGAARRGAESLEGWRHELAEAVAYHTFVQCVFRYQWSQLQGYARTAGVDILGDIPIFVSYDSVDVWANPELFELDESRRPVAVAGVPPDYFNELGQLWGNPLYNWPVMEERRFDWWVERFRLTFTLVNAIRLDHFLGFDRCWRIPAGEADARRGEFVKTPGRFLFKAVHDALGPLPIIAEDLGVVTPAAEALRDEFDFPGMKVLQFGFVADAIPENQPHGFRRNLAVYSGTHDNDTTVGWWQSRGEDERRWVVRYLGYEPEAIEWAVIQMGMASVANTAIFPMQDLLGLGSKARMNQPGMAQGNWAWRMAPGLDLSATAARLRAMARMYNRI